MLWVLANSEADSSDLAATATTWCSVSGSVFNATTKSLAIKPAEQMPHLSAILERGKTTDCVDNSTRINPAISQSTPLSSVLYSMISKIFNNFWLSTRPSIGSHTRVSQLITFCRRGSSSRSCEGGAEYFARGAHFFLLER